MVSANLDGFVVANLFRLIIRDRFLAIIPNVVDLVLLSLNEKALFPRGIVHGDLVVTSATTKAVALEAGHHSRRGNAIRFAIARLVIAPCVGSMRHAISIIES